MRCFKYLFLLFVISSCNKVEPVKAKNYRKYVGAKKAVVVSCYKCSCIIPKVAAFFNKDPANETIMLLADSNCNSSNEIGKFKQLPQALIDSVFIRNNNALLFKIVSGDVEMRLIKTEDAENFDKIATDFFKD